MQRIEKERAETFGSLKSSLESVALGQQALQKETRTLVNALRRPEVRGQWGEMTLRRLAELAGMVEHCDFAEQVHVRTDDGASAPRHDRAHARRPRSGRRREDAARCVPRSGRCDHRRSCAPWRCGGTRRPSPSAYGSSAPRTTGTSSRRVPTSSSCSSRAISSCPPRWPRSPHAARGRDPPGRDHRDAVELRRDAEGGRLRLAADGAGAERRNDPHARRGSVQAPRGLHRPPHQARPQPRAPASRPSTAPSARSNARCCPARASSPSSACGRIARSKRSNRSTS